MAPSYSRESLPCPWLQNLRRKAEQRNPDEFYFAMERKGTKGGIHSGRYGNIGPRGAALCTMCQHIPSIVPAKHLLTVWSLSCSITEANKYTQEELRFMKSQDASYMALRAQTEMKVHPFSLACNSDLGMSRVCICLL